MKSKMPFIKRVDTIISVINIDFKLLSFPFLHPLYLHLIFEIQLAHRLVSICTSLNEYPYIRFRAGNPLSGCLAAVFQDNLESHIRQNSAYWYHGMSNIAQRATIIFLDRTEDCIAPLLHEFSYEALLSDLFHYDGTKLQYTSSSNAEMKQNEFLIMKYAEPWKSIRYTHIKEVKLDFL